VKAFKTEINPTNAQKIKINQTMGVCRLVYNLFINRNKETYEQTKTFISGMSFSLWLNNTYLLDHPEHAFIKDVSSKAVKRAIMCAETAFKRFFKKKAKFPKYKSKRKRNASMYFINSGVHIHRHKIKIPTLGWVQLKEKGYIPTNKRVLSGTVTAKAGRYYVSVLFHSDEQPKPQLTNEGVGIDVGIKTFATLSTGQVYNKGKLTKLNKTLKRRQRRLSKQLRLKKKGGAATLSAKNVDKSINKVQKIHATISNIRNDFLNKTVDSIVKTKPLFITVESLNVKGMLKNRHLSKAIATQSFYTFKLKLLAKCVSLGIELREVSKWFPSSKQCSNCGYIHKDLKLSDRTYICPECGYTIDRDLNAAINLRNATAYTLA